MCDVKNSFETLQNSDNLEITFFKKKDHIKLLILQEVLLIFKYKFSLNSFKKHSPAVKVAPLLISSS